MTCSHAGADWIESSLKKKCSPLGREVADLLGDVYGGIYHMNHGSLERASWGDNYCVEVTLCGDLATVDQSHLTCLVVFAHDRMIRINLFGVGPRCIRAQFHQRFVRDGSIMDYCPTIERHAEIVRGAARP
jgi:hypothetical protein